MSRTFIVQDGVVLPAAPDDEIEPLTPGTLIDKKYKIVSLLGQGGMGSVYLAHHQALDKDMALKTFRSCQIDQDAAKRFELEARAIAKLSHKNIVQVFDFGVHDGRPFYTMELLSGSSLVKYTSDRSLSLREVLSIFSEVAEGLSHAHKVGIIHRDIKPDNIYLGAPKEKAGKISSVKIVDFGIAKLALDETSDESVTDQSVTKVGRVFGSPLYMSPEQSVGLPTDHTTDIYSFGCALFEAITGRPPFVGENSGATLAMHRMEPPPTLAKVQPDRVFPQRLEGLVARLLMKDKEARIQSCDEIRQELRRILRQLEQGNIPGATTVAPLSNTSTRPEFTRQAKTDPLLAADRAMSKLIKERPKQLAAAGLALAALACGAGILAAVHFAGLGDKNGPKAHVPSVGFAYVKSPKELQPVSKVILACKDKPPARFLVRQTAKTKVFNFPFGEPIGRLECGDVNKAAVGEIEVQKNASVKFEAGHAVVLAPALLGGFIGDDIQDLRFSSLEIWPDEPLKWTSNMTGLERLEVDNCELTPASIQYLDKLSGLRRLSCSGTKITALQWCTLKILPQLAELKVEVLPNSLALISKLKQKNNLVNLEIDAGDVSDAGVTYIGTFKKLDRLKLMGGNISLRGLKELLNLPHLRDLNLTKCHLPPESMEILATFPALKELEVETGAWGYRNQARIHQIMAQKGIKLTQTCEMRMPGH